MHTTRPGYSNISPVVAEKSAVIYPPPPILSPGMIYISEISRVCTIPPHTTMCLQHHKPHNSTQPQDHSRTVADPQYIYI